MNSLRNARFVDREDGLIDYLEDGLEIISPIPERKNQQITTLEARIKNLEEELKKCKLKLTELKFRPGGPGYEKAKQRFEMGVAKQIASKKVIKKSPKKKRIFARKSLTKAKSI